MSNDTFDSPTIQIPLTQGYVAIVDDIDGDLSQYSWCARVDRNTVYAARDVRVNPNAKKTVLRIHRLILERILNRPLLRNEFVDHEDGDGLNNRRSNLRLATRLENNRNTRLRSNNTSGYKGVIWNKRGRGWEARIRVNGNLKSLGTYRDIKVAAQKYNEAAVLYFGEFASLNAIPE